MISAILLSASMAMLTEPGAIPTAGDSALYREAAAAAGRDADAHVQLALWCEARGMSAERLKHLTRAVLLSPDNQTARGLLGQVENEGRWSRPDDVRAALEDDPQARTLRDEYLKRRAATADKVADQIKLARWCDENGLSDQSVAHYRAALRIDPSREAVWKRLGYRKSGGRWALPKEIEAEQTRREALRAADRRWRPELERLRDRLAGKDAEAARLASEALDAVDDPLAVPTIWDLFARGDVRRQRRAAEMFARIDGRAASLALAELAVISAHAEIRGLAADLLDRRDPRDYVDPLLELLHKPFRYTVRPIAGIGTEGGVFAEGERYNVLRVYQLVSTDPTQVPARLFTDDIPLQTGFTTTVQSGTSPAPMVFSVPFATGRPNGGSLFAEAVRRDQLIARILAAEAEQLQTARLRLASDVAELEQINAGVRSVNDRVLPLIRAVAGRDFGEDQDAWKEWWTDQLGYAYRSHEPEEKPTYTEVEQVFSPVSIGFHTACFAAGTPVHTLAGLTPIEEVKVGDLVLSQDVETGAVAFKPVLLTHVNPPTAMVRLSMGGEDVTATGIHRFWRPGVGWTMARDLKVGDRVRTLSGVAVIEAVASVPAAEVYNLDVAENLDFYVGRAGVLVHDFSIVREPSRPFDASEVGAVAISR